MSIGQIIEHWQAGSTLVACRTGASIDMFKERERVYSTCMLASCKTNCGINTRVVKKSNPRQDRDNPGLKVITAEDLVSLSRGLAS
jgi:hypothetical protein